MNDPKDQQEPSMEEILSSIRRIIADEESEDRDARDLDLSGEPASSDDEAEDEDDVLELTEVVVERGDDGVAAAHEPDPEEAPPELEAEADELTEDDQDDEVDHVDEVELLPAEPDAIPDDVPDVPPAPPLQTPAASEGLVSAVAAGATTGAFAKLSQAMHPDSEGEAPVPDSDRSIEAFLAELLRPMLREWLEENLPPMVERLVAEEIEKLAKRAELL